MPSALVFCSSGTTAPPLRDDLHAVGIETMLADVCTDLLQGVIKRQPDLVVCFEQAPDPAFFHTLAAIAESAPRPAIVFTEDPDADKIALATRSGIHAYIVSGYSRARLRSIVHLAQARYEGETALRRELAELRTRFEERKLVDRAKGILMGARQLREDEAFKALRTSAMASKQRIGQVSKTVIDAARYAEAMNRAGQLRMLSQRLVKLYALSCSGTGAGELVRFNQSMAQVDATLALLDALLSRKTFGDLVVALAGPWAAFKTALQQPARRSRLSQVDALSEAFLLLAERLSANLEVAAYAPALGVINTVGRQRMLSQRLAKQAILRHLHPTGNTPAAEQQNTTALAEFTAGLDYLAALPLSNADIAREMVLTTAAWQEFQRAMSTLDAIGGFVQLEETSETLLGHFDRLTDLLERGIQALVC